MVEGLAYGWRGRGRLPLGTVAAIEFLPVVASGGAGSRTRRNVLALLLAVGGVYLFTDVRLFAEPVGIAFAAANALLFALYIVLGHQVARSEQMPGIDGLALSMLIAAAVAVPQAGWSVILSRWSFGLRHDRWLSAVLFHECRLHEFCLGKEQGSPCLAIDWGSAKSAGLHAGCRSCLSGGPNCRQPHRTSPASCSCTGRA